MPCIRGREFSSVVERLGIAPAFSLACATPMREDDATAKVICSLGAAARTARSSEEFLTALLSTLIGTLSARAGVVYLADQCGVILPFGQESSVVCSVSELTACAWFGVSPQTAGVVRVPPNILLDTDEGWLFFQTNVPEIPITQARVFPIRVSEHLRGAVIIYGIKSNRVSDVVMEQALSEACAMLDILTDRFLQRDLVELNDFSLSTVSADGSYFMSTLIVEARKKLGCEGISLFVRDTTEEVPTFRLVATAPRSMPEKPMHYSAEDFVCMSRLFGTRTVCAVHYDRMRREDVADLGAPKWRDVPATSEAQSVIFAVVVKGDQPVALLRCTNRCSPDSTANFNWIDLLRADAFASLLMNWHVAAEKEQRFASSLMEISHDIISGAAGVRSAANFVKRELPKRLSWNAGADLGYKLDDIAKAAESIIKVMPALRRASGSTVTSVEAGRGFRPYLDLCRPICALFREQATARRLTFQFSGQDQLGLLYADIEDFRVIFQNLVSNAVKYTFVGKEIFVHQQRAEGVFASMNVVSESLPVPSEERDAIFRFRYRAVAARAGGTEGQGLGLAIARAKARQLGGDLIFKTTDDFNIFSLLIPVKLFRPFQKDPPNANSHS